jgi:shikimate kinase
MNASQPLPKNLVLIGFMASGKSAVGRELHQRLGYPLVDMDQVIEQRVGKSINAIFEEDGEDVFRRLESEVLNELKDPRAPRKIISTGGGVIGSAANRSLLRQIGFVIWLHTSEAVILERASKNRDRPLLQAPDPAAVIKELMAVRRPLYAEVAHLEINTAGLDCSEIATGILDSARYFFTSL